MLNASDWLQSGNHYIFEQYTDYRYFGGNKVILKSCVLLTHMRLLDARHIPKTILNKSPMSGVCKHMRNTSLWCVNQVTIQWSQTSF